MRECGRAPGATTKRRRLASGLIEYDGSEPRLNSGDARVRALRLLLADIVVPERKLAGL